MTRINFAKITVFALVVSGALLRTGAQTTNAQPQPYDHLFQNDVAKISYAVGAKFGADVSNVLRKIELDADTGEVIHGFVDRISATPRVNDAQVAEIIEKFEASLQDALNVKHRKEGDEFRAMYKQTNGVESTASGILYKPISGPTAGPKPGPDDTVTVNYRLSLINGTECDSTYVRGHPAQLSLSGVLAGWREALPMMPVGAKWQIVLPPELAYGDQGVRPMIGPGETLIFEIELIATKPPTKTATLGNGSPIVMVPPASEIAKGAQPRLLTEEEAQAMAAAAAKTNQAPTKPAAH